MTFYAGPALGDAAKAWDGGGDRWLKKRSGCGYQGLSYGSTGIVENGQVGAAIEPLQDFRHPERANS